ncbi:MAG: hypothetical protein IJL55_00835 [Lachnospiraceae bacterium]|nr:hypothetical protein [Lachnospiraceae bacterium]
MSTKSKNISDLVYELQEENERLHSLWRLFSVMCRSIFGYDAKEIMVIIEKLTIYENREAARQDQQLDSSR